MRLLLLSLFSSLALSSWAQSFHTFYPEPFPNSIRHSPHALPYQLPPVHRYAEAPNLPHNMHLKQVLGDNRWMLPTQGWSVEYSPEGDLLIAGGYNCVVAFEAESGKRLWSFWGNHEPYFYSHPVRALAMNAKRQHLVVGNDAGQVLLLNYRTGKLLSVLGDGEEWIMDVAVSDDGKYAAACSIKGQLQVWNLKTRLPVDFPPFKNTRLEALRFHSDNQRLAVGGSKAFAILDLKKQSIQQFPAPNTVHDILFLDPDNLIICGWEGFVQQWSINDSGKPIWSKTVGDNWVNQLFPGPNPYSFLFTTAFHIGHFDIETQKAEQKESLNIRQGVSMHPTSKRLAYLPAFAQRIKQSTWPALERELSPGDLNYPDICYSPKGDYLATANYLAAEQVFLWKLPEGELFNRIVLPPRQGVEQMLFSTNSQFIKANKRANNVRYQDGRVHVLDIKKQQNLKEWDKITWQKEEYHRSMNLEDIRTVHHKKSIPIPTAAYHGWPDSSSINRHLFGGFDLERMYFAAVRNDNQLIIADAQTGAVRAALALPHRMPTACAIHPWDKEVALSCNDGLVYIYRYDEQPPQGK